MCFFMNGWKGARLGRLGICCVKKKKCSLKSTLCCLTPLFCLFVWFSNFYFFLPSQTWMVGFSLDRLQKILCLVFVCCVPFYSPFCAHLFFPKNFWIFSKISHFGICLLGFLRIFSPLFCDYFYFSVYYWSNYFLFKIQFHKRRTSTV